MSERGNNKDAGARTRKRTAAPPQKKPSKRTRRRRSAQSDSIRTSRQDVTDDRSGQASSRLDKKTAPEPRKAAAPKRQRSAAQVVGGFFGHLFPLVALGVALVGAGALYQRSFDMGSAAAADAKSTMTEQAVVPVEDQAPAAYVGVEDRWILEGLFTTGDEGLDHQIKQFCDEHAVSGGGAAKSAEATFKAIVEEGSDYTDAETPSGTGWVQAAARAFFDGMDDGVNESADVYGMAAATAVCLRYYGYEDAMAVPALAYDANGGQYGLAYCLVTDEHGKECVCDFSAGEYGWMKDRAYYDILVENIGQDLTAVEEMGLEVQALETNAAPNVAQGDTQSMQNDAQGPTQNSIANGNGTTADAYGDNAV